VRGQRDIDIGQASALVLARLGIAAPANARGRVPEGWLAQTHQKALPEAPVPTTARGDRGALERRLRALGYID
jgi:hypothetical protein